MLGVPREASGSTRGWVPSPRRGPIVSLVLAGVALLALSLLVLAVGAVVPESSLLRTIAFALAGASVPVLLAGVVLLHPDEAWVRACGGVGLALCAGGLILFVGWFPQPWARLSSTPIVLALAEYLLGLGLLAAGAASVLADAATASRAQAETAGSREGAADPAKAGDGTGTFTWGGVSTDRPSVRLVIEDGTDGVQLEGSDGYLLRVEDGGSVDLAVDALLAIQGRGQVSVRTEPGVASQAQRLYAIRMWDAIELAEVRPWWHRLVPPYR